MIALVADLEYLSYHSYFYFDARPAVNRHLMYLTGLDEMVNSEDVAQIFVRSPLCDDHHHLNGHVMAISFVLSLKYDHVANCMNHGQVLQFSPRESNHRLLLNL